ncbi:hypothetical protein [Paenibacillus lutrae]|uniref:Uncharacterized protein n=1 Tax=Paenibacillus lutrae TaxID=2078573 RepID=A0A7X3FJ58_9BACL|nr:hypothetical protein [Paenibacillus lutrae]MVP00469.1 hypothetical protein [Paenibacillus lutrae]
MNSVAAFAFLQINLTRAQNSLAGAQRVQDSHELEKYSRAKYATVFDGMRLVLGAVVWKG